ncbi:hypothetical protein L6R50_00350 [Myxococcota bacterium]|nr:hypothetical protein [Myxococcota bacterium]
MASPTPPPPAPGPTLLLPPPPRRTGLRYTIALIDAGEAGPPLVALAALSAVLLGIAAALLSPDLRVWAVGQPGQATWVGTDPWPAPGAGGTSWVSVTARLPGGEVLRQVVPSAAARSLAADGPVPVRVLPGAPGVARLLAFPVSAGGSMWAAAVALPGLACGIAAAARLARNRWRTTLWLRGGERAGVVLRGGVARIGPGGAPGLYRVNATWEVPQGSGRPCSGAVRGFVADRMPLLEAERPLVVLLDPETGRGLPAHLVPRGWPRGAE